MWYLLRPDCFRVDRNGPAVSPDGEICQLLISWSACLNRSGFPSQNSCLLRCRLVSTSVQARLSLGNVIFMEFQPGDIAACYGTDWTSRLIRWGTCSIFPPAPLRLGPSHVALLCRWRERMIWVESTTLCQHPCLFHQRPVSGVQAHAPEERIGDYVRQHGWVEIYRLTQFHRLCPQESRLLTKLLLDEFLGVELRYDLRGAMLSGTRLLQLTRCFPGADLEELFCSELVAAVVMRMQRMNHSNPSRYNPARLLRELVHLGKYQKVAVFSGADAVKLSQEAAHV